MSIDWKCNDMLAWEKEAKQIQQNYLDVFGGHQWTEYKEADYHNLKRKIGFAIFDAPEENPDCNNDFTGYNVEELSAINEIVDAIKRQHKGKQVISVSFLYVCVRGKGLDVTAPVISLKNDIFIDANARVYKNWKHYLATNILPDSVLCYPRNGKYSSDNGYVDVEFGISPAGTPRAKALQKVDDAAAVFGAGAVFVEIAALFLPVPSAVIKGSRIVSVATQVYSTGRDVQTLVDRATHEQPIGFGHSESRNCWLRIAGCVTGFVSEYASSIKTVSLTGQTIITSITAVSCVVNGVGVVNGLANIIKKVVKKKEVTSLDILQFTSAVLFFRNAVISADVAYSALKAIQSNAAQGSSAVNSLQSSITAVSNGICLCTSMAIKSVVSEAIEMICKWAVEKLLVLATHLLQGSMNKFQYIIEVVKVVQRFWEKWNEEMSCVITKICEALGVKHWSYIIVRGFRVLQNIDTDHMRKLCDTAETRNSETTEQNQFIPKSNDIGENRNDLDKACSDLPSDILNIHKKFVDLQQCKEAVEFHELMKFVCKFVKDEFEKEKLGYEKMWKLAQNLKPGVTEEYFDQKYGISGNRNDHFLQTVLKKFEDGETEGLIALKLAYDSQKAVMSGQSSFEGIPLYTFSNKKGSAPNGMLSREQYYDIARELTKEEDAKNISLHQRGSIAVILVNDSQFVITVQSYPEAEPGKVSGIAAILAQPSHNTGN